MKVLLTGAEGQLGRELQLSCPPQIELLTRSRAELDIRDAGDVMTQVLASGADVIINAAAYTAVDGAESKPDLAVAINAEAPGYLARAAQHSNARLLHVSTDFVFDGAASSPYRPQQEPRPLGVYGHSKLAGERRVQEILPMRSLIVRTAWVYSRFGSNFVKTMLRLMAERDGLSVVADQRGAPTWARSLAVALWGLLPHTEAHGVCHWTDAGECSWHEFALTIQQRALALGLLKSAIPIEAIPTSEYPTPATRPAYSVLDITATERLLGTPALAWQDQLEAMLADLAEAAEERA